MKYLIILLGLSGCLSQTDSALDICTKGCNAAGKYVESLEYNRAENQFDCKCGRIKDCKK